MIKEVTEGLSTKHGVVSYTLMHEFTREFPGNGHQDLGCMDTFPTTLGSIQEWWSLW
jgi:hypothetical protein